MIDETQTMKTEDEGSFRSKHRFFILIAASILVASVLVVISLAIYNGSGAAQLDLSRPGYNDIRAQVITTDSEIKNYSNLGPISQDAISEFKSIFGQQATKIKAVDAFGGDPLNPEALGITVKPE